MKEKFLITETSPNFFTEGLEDLGYEVHNYIDLSKNEVEKIIENYTGLLIRGRIEADKSLIQKAKKLKYILRPGSGLDIINKELAIEKGITLINSPEGNRDSVGEHALGLLLSFLHKIPSAIEEVKHFEWDRNRNTGVELMGKTVGIIGYGNTGSSFAKRLSGFSVKTLAYDKYKTGFSDSFAEESNMERIFDESDILSLHIPLTSETKFLVNKEYLGKFKKPIIVINTSRGKIIETQELFDSIVKGKVIGSCLDVLENESFSSLNDNEKSLLNKLQNSGKVLITPHIAGKTIESEKKIYSFLLDRLKK